MKKAGLIMLALAPVLAAVIPLAASVSVGASGILNAPLIRLKNGTSTNWSGYAVEEATTDNSSGLFGAENYAVTDVQGSWVVPKVSEDTAATISTSAPMAYRGKGNGGHHGPPPPTPSTSGYSAAWVGIDGYSDGTVEQIGTEQDWTNGAPSYYAWFEMYPKFGYELNPTAYPVSPGDKMTAGVHYANGEFTLTISDTSWLSPFVITEKSPRAQRQSAEWIMEAPSSSGGVLPLANFDKIYFSGAQATINGSTEEIPAPTPGLGTASSARLMSDNITMESSTGTVEAVPSSPPTDAGGTSSFSVTWKSS